jgi:hypothetical protein
MKILRKSVLIASVLTGMHSASAEQCTVNFNYGVVIAPAQVRILQESQTYVQINENKQLFVLGRLIQLDAEQSELIAKYSRGIRQQVPEIVSIAIEGVDIGLKAVNKVIAGLTGENSASHQKVQERFSELQWRLRNRFNHSDQNYYIAPQDFEDFDEIFAGEFEQEIESIVTESIGSILMAVGEAVTHQATNNNEANSEQRTHTFDERMENMGKDLKLEINEKTLALESKAALFCNNLIELDHLENELQFSIPELSDFNLIEAQ